MKLTDQPRFIVSYAGLQKPALIARASRAVSPSGVPARLRGFLPVFPYELIQSMDYVAADRRFSRDIADYHRMMYKREPSLYVEDNLRRNLSGDTFTGRGTVSIDRAWIERFPQLQGFAGEALQLHLIGGGAQAVVVPQSLYPRLGRMLDTMEAELGVQRAAQLYAQYALQRIHDGESYDAVRFANEYAQSSGLCRTMIMQSELEQTLQDAGVAQSLRGDDGGAMYTQSAMRSCQVKQYQKGRYAADSFEWQPVTKNTLRLCQPAMAADDPLSDLWMPYIEVQPYIDRKLGTISARELCDGYQIAPQYDPGTLGGRYPAILRVFTVADRAMRLLVGDALNNPAYGSGMSPTGMISKQIALPDSKELVRQGKLKEERSIPLSDLEAPTRVFLEQAQMGLLQQLKGEWVDAMYRREAAQNQLAASGSKADERTLDKIAKDIERLEARIDVLAARHPQSHMSGYDADADYLRRKALARENLDPFTIDQKREDSVESGYAMRREAPPAPYNELALPIEEPIQEEGQPEAAEQGAAEREAADAAKPKQAVMPQAPAVPAQAPIAAAAPPRSEAPVEVSEVAEEPSDHPTTEAAISEAPANIETISNSKTPAPQAPTPQTPAASTPALNKAPAPKKRKKKGFSDLPTPTAQINMFELTGDMRALAQKQAPAKPDLNNKSGMMARLAKQNDPDAPQPKNMQELLDSLLKKDD